MFLPKYTITDKLLANIKEINSLIFKLNNRHFPKVVLLELERVAREVSSHASTSIEGNPLPLTEVKKILKSKPANIGESQKEVLNYNEALRALNLKFGKKNPSISADLILQIHKIVMRELLPNPQDIGAFRKSPVVIGSPVTGKILYLPPDTNEVNFLISELIEYINKNRDITDPLILAGVFHKQTVLIHPFMDGNGRTTRLATKVLLAQMGLDTFNLFSFENYYNKNVTRYFQYVGERGDYYELREKIDFTAWLEYFTEGIIDELTRVQTLLPKAIKDPTTELNKHHLQIIAFIQENGFIKDNDYAKLTERAKATRILDFQKLMNLGLIERKGKA